MMGVLTLVRHGQASFLEENYDKLSPLGEKQARILGEYWARRGVVFDCVYSGPHVRQIGTAEIVGQALREAGLPWPEPTLIEGLAEFPIEELAKTYLPQLMADDPELARLILEFQNAPGRVEKEHYLREGLDILIDHWVEGRLDGDSLESWDAFMKRVESAVQEMTTAHVGKQVVAFTSGGPTAVTTRYALGATTRAAMDLSWVVRNGSLTEFVFTEKRFTLNTFNDVHHFEDPELITHH